MARRIRVFFINCPTIDTDAAAFLILSQNQVQSALQFEVYHFWAYEVTAHGPLKGTKGRIVSFSEESFHSRSVRYLERKYRQELDLRAAPEFSSELSSKTWQQACENAISAHDAWLNASRYPLSDAGAAAPSHPPHRHPPRRQDHRGAADPRAHVGDDGDGEPEREDDELWHV